MLNFILLGEWSRCHKFSWKKIDWTNFWGFILNHILNGYFFFGFFIDLIIGVVSVCQTMISSNKEKFQTASLRPIQWILFLNLFTAWINKWVFSFISILRLICTFYSFCTTSEPLPQASTIIVNNLKLFSCFLRHTLCRLPSFFKVIRIRGKCFYQF